MEEVIDWRTLANNSWRGWLNCCWYLGAEYLDCKLSLTCTKTHTLPKTANHQPILVLSIISINIFQTSSRELDSAFYLLLLTFASRSVRVGRDKYAEIRPPLWFLPVNRPTPTHHFRPQPMHLPPKPALRTTVFAVEITEHGA